MDRKEEKMLGILRHKTKIYTVKIIYHPLIIKYDDHCLTKFVRM